MEDLSQPAWSDQVHEADWIAERLGPFGRSVTSVVPGGFEAYGRMLHPAEAPHLGHGQLVRWREVAAWSGVELRPNSPFHSVAMPSQPPETAAPWKGQGPSTGSLYPADAQVLSAVLREWTSTPEDCWFCLWAGYGWETGGAMLAARGEPAEVLPSPIPDGVLGGPHVHLPGREYLLYHGPVEAVTATMALSMSEQTPKIWWPADQAGCVASEIDLAWSYIGGTRALVESLLADERLEVLPAKPGDRLSGVEDWLVRMVAAAVDELWLNGETTITTSRGTVQGWLKKPGRGRRGWLRTRSVGDNGVSGGSDLPLRRSTEQQLRDEVESHLVWDVIDLVGG